MELKMFQILRAKLWDLLSGGIKNSSSLSVFIKMVPWKMSIQALSDIYKKISVIFDLSQTIARLAVVFWLKI